MTQRHVERVLTMGSLFDGIGGFPLAALHFRTFTRHKTLIFHVIY